MSITPTNVEHEVKSVDIIVSKGNEAGDIIYANPVFFKLAGYSKAELLEQSHSIIRHPDMPKTIFKFLWDNIKEGQEVKAFVKNLSQDGGFYWVFAHVHRASNPDGSFRNYISTRKTMSKTAREAIEPLYASMIEAEKENGVEGSLEVLASFLEQQGSAIANFNDTMEKLQNS